MNPLVAIIGAGPAGAAAAIQLKRYGYSILLFEKNKIGGLLNHANLIENYLGFPLGISGVELSNKIEEQLNHSQIEVIKENVEYICFKDDFIISTTKHKYNADICIVATGVKPKELYCVPEELIEKKVFYDFCNMKNIENETIGIIGSGDAAFDYAISLSNRNSVTIFSRSIKLNAINCLIEKVKENEKITLIKDIKVINIVSYNEKILLYCLKGSRDNFVEVDKLLIAIGRQPEQPPATPAAANNKSFYLIGDLIAGSFRQCSLASASGIKIAMDIHRIIKEKESENYRGDI